MDIYGMAHNLSATTPYSMKYCQAGAPTLTLTTLEASTCTMTFTITLITTLTLTFTTTATTYSTATAYVPTVAVPAIYASSSSTAASIPDNFLGGASETLGPQGVVLSTLPKTIASIFLTAAIIITLVTIAKWRVGRRTKAKGKVTRKDQDTLGRIHPQSDAVDNISVERRDQRWTYTRMTRFMREKGRSSGKLLVANLSVNREMGADQESTSIEHEQPQTGITSYILETRSQSQMVEAIAIQATSVPHNIQPTRPPISSAQIAIDLININPFVDSTPRLYPDRCTLFSDTSHRTTLPAYVECEVMPSMRSTLLDFPPQYEDIRREGQHESRRAT